MSVDTAIAQRVGDPSSPGRIDYDKAHKPVEVTAFLFAADRHSFTYVVPLD